MIRRTSRRFRHGARSGAAIVLCLAAALLDGAAHAAATPSARGARGMVVAAEARAADVGLEVLRRGGNAVDAAVATAFALAVTYPRAGNLGGGGFLLVRRPGGECRALDFREIAPRRLRPEHFLDERGRPVPERSVRGGLAVGVPGTVAGLWEAHRLWGRLPWSRLVAPAIRLAEKGVRVSRISASTFAAENHALAADPAARAIFTRDGAPLREGDLLVQRDLGSTLRRIARRGAEGFYRGEVAARIAASVARAGGVLDEEDLAAYRPMSREPVVGSYRGYRVVSFPPPSSGGIVLLQILAMIEGTDLRATGAGSSRTAHAMAEAERRAFADRTRWMGDPAFFRVPVERLLDPAYLADRAASIREDRATPSTEIRSGDLGGPEGAQTTHLSVGDCDGGAAALTTTLNSLYGAARVADGTGVLLNNEIDDFTLAADTPNQFGLLGAGSANLVAGGKRPLSSMAPTVVERPGGRTRPLLVLGSPGGPTIITTVLQILVNVIDHGMELQEAVDAPRFHHQWQPDRIDHEKGAFVVDVAEALSRRGHALHEREAIGDAAVIGSEADGTWRGAADPRGEGVARGF